MGNKRKNNTTSNAPNKRSRAQQARGNAGKTAVVAKQSSPLSKKRKVSKISAQPFVEPTNKNAKRTHTDHSNDPAYCKAAQAWFDTPAHERLGKIAHAEFHQVPCVKTFLRYIDDIEEKRRTLGKRPCRPSNVDDETTEELIQYVISYNRANDKELPNAKIVNKLLKIMPMPKLSRPVARDYVRRTFKKKLNERSKPTHNVKGYRFVKLNKGTSNRLQQLVRKHVKGVKEQDVFSCDHDTHRKLTRPQRNKFILSLNKDSYTDGKRKLRNICQDDFIKEEVVSKILATLRADLDAQDHTMEEPVLLTTEESTETIFRQQLHRDFQNGDDSSLFVIIPLCEDQTIYYEKNGGISSIKLSKDVAFVGHSQLIHAGSEQPGKRLHFKLVEEGQVEDTKTYFVEDSLYPGISGILKFK